MYDARRIRNIVEVKGWGGGKRMEEQEREVCVNEQYGIALVEYKSMEQLIKEFPDHYFDQYGNFNTGVTTDQKFNNTDIKLGLYDHLAPTYFGQMGHTAHRTYLKEDGIPKDTWYYKVIDY